MMHKLYHAASQQTDPSLGPSVHAVETNPTVALASCNQF